MSTLLVLTMLLTTFCCFDIGSLISSALVDRDTHDLRSASMLNNFFSTYNMNFTEMVYLKAWGKESQYFLNNEIDGAAKNGYEYQGTMYFKCKNADTVRVSAQLLSTDFGLPADGNYITDISFADGTSASGTNTDGINRAFVSPRGSINTSITSIKLNNAVLSTNNDPKEYIIRWTVVYTCGGNEYTTYAYTGIYAPNINIAGMLTKDRRVRSGWNTPEMTAMSYIMGAQKYSGGNYTTNKDKINPMGGIISATENDEIADICQKYLSPEANGGVFVITNSDNKECNEDDTDVKDTRAYKTENSFLSNNWTYYGNYTDPTPTGSTTVFFGDANNGTVTSRISDGDYRKSTYNNLTTGVAYLLVDSSRYNNYSQLPGFGAGFICFSASRSNAWLSNILSINVAANNDTSTGKITGINVSTKRTTDFFSCGPHSLNGTVSAGFDLIGVRYQTYASGVTKNNYMNVTHTIGLHTTTINRGNLRTLYYKYLNSGVNTADTTNWSTINTKIEQIVKKLCTVRGNDVSFSSTGFDTLIENSQAKLEEIMVNTSSDGSVLSPIAFVVPEQIYLYPNGTSFRDSTATPFQYFVENDIDLNDLTKPPKAKSDTSTEGTIYFVNPNAKNGTIRLSYRWLEQDYSTPISVTDGTYGYLKFKDDSGSLYPTTATSLKNEKTINLDSSNVGTYTLTSSGSMSPSLSSSTTGVVIEWKLSYTDKNDNYDRTLVAYTYVYKPYTVPLAGGVETAGYQSYGGMITWLSGFQSLTPNGTLYGVTGDGDGSYETHVGALRYKSGQFSLAGFIGKENVAYTGATGSASKITSGSNATKSGLGTVNYAVSSSQQRYTVFSGTGSSSGLPYLNTSDYKNNNPDAFRVGTTDDAGYKLNNFQQIRGSSSKDYLVTMLYVSSKANIYIDTSRYTNLSQIPNLGIGHIVTDDEDTQSNTGSWYVASYTDPTTTVGITGRTHKNEIDCDNAQSGCCWQASNQDHGPYIADQRAKNNNLNDANATETEGLRYSGDWVEAVDNTVTSKTYAFKSFYSNLRDSRSEGNVCSVIIDMVATQLDKSSLRDIMGIATMNLNILGVADTDMNSYYFNGTTYNNFKKYYKDAYAVLTKLDGTYGTYTTQAQIDNLSDNLKDALAELVGGYDHDSVKHNGGTDLVGLNVKQVDIGLTKMLNGEVRINILDTHSMRVTTRDTVYFTLDEYTGYTFDGSIRVDNDVSVSDGTLMHEPLSEFMTSTSYVKNTATLSGGYLSFTPLTNDLVQQKVNNGVVVEDKTSADYGSVTYNWVTRQDGDMVLYYFYTRNQFTTYFDLNYGDYQPNVAAVGDYSYYNKSLFTFDEEEINGEKLIYTLGDFTVKYNLETDIFTFNGVLSQPSANIFSTLLSLLPTGKYTDCFYYVGGTVTKPSSDTLTLSESCYTPNLGQNRTDYRDWYPAGISGQTQITLTPDSIIGEKYTINYVSNTSPGDHTSIITWRNGSDPIEYKDFQVRLARVSGENTQNIFSPNARIIFYGETYGTLPKPTRKDYDFLGWYTEKENGNRIDSSTLVEEGDRTLYAHWRPSNYRISLDNEFNFTDWVNCNPTTSSDATYLKSSASSLTTKLLKDGYNDTVISCRGSSSGYIKTPDIVFDGKETTVLMDLNIIDFVKTSSSDLLYIRLKTTSGTVVEEGTFTSTTAGYSDFNMNINSTQMATNTNYYVEIGVSGNVKSQFEIKQLMVLNEDDVIKFSLDDSMVNSSFSDIKVDKRSQSFLMNTTSTATDAYTHTYNGASSYRMKLKTDIKYTLSFDYNILSGASTTNIRPMLFFANSENTEGFASAKDIRFDVPSTKKTGSCTYEFEVPSGSEYVEIRMGSLTASASILYSRIVVQETYVYDQKEGKYSTINKLGGLTNNSTNGYLASTTDQLKNQENYWEKFTIRYSDVEINAKYDKIQVPTRDGYLFMGWFTEPAGGTQVTDSYGNSVGDERVTGEQVLYSQWIKAVYQLLYENEFVYENWESSVEEINDINQHEYRDGFSNSVTLEGRGVSKSPSTNQYTMNLISGHTYEFTCTVENVSEVNSAQYWAMPKVCINNGESNVYPRADNFLKANGTNNIGTISQTFTMSGSSFRIYFYHSAYGDGNKANGYDNTDGMLNSASIKYTNIHIRDLTDPCNIRSTDSENTILTTKEKNVNYSETFGELPSTKASASEANNISRVGYVFKGWFSSQNSTGNGYGTQYSSSNVVKLNDTPMYAQWALKNPTISLNLNGTAKNTATLGAFTYYTSSLDTSTGNITKDTAVSVTQKTSNTNAATVTLTPYYSSTVTLPIPTMVGYTFDAWTANTTPAKAVLTSNAEASPSTYKVGDGNATLKANWVVNDYTISYEMNNGTNNAANVDANGSTKSAQFDTAVKITNPTKTGWVFEGWTLTTDTAGYTTACYYTTDANNATSITDSTTKFGKNDSSIYVLNLTPTKGYTITLVAHWSKVITAKVYTINPTTYEIDTQTIQNTIIDSETSTTVNLNNPSDFTWNSVAWSFKGWRTDTSGEYPQVAKPTSVYSPTLNATDDNNTTYYFYASYNNGNKVYYMYYDGSEETYELSGHKKVNTVPYMLAYKKDGEYPTRLYTLTGNLYESWTPTKKCDGATFVRWEDSGLLGNITRQAVYEKSVTLTYDLNDSVNFPAHFENTVSLTQTKTASYKSNLTNTKASNNQFTIINDVPKREGFLFLGWGTSDDENAATEYVGGQELYLSTTKKIDDKTIYAVWLDTLDVDEARESELPTMTISIEKGYDSSGGKLEPDVVLKYKDEDVDEFNDAVTAYDTSYTKYVTARNTKTSTKTQLDNLRKTLVDNATALKASLASLELKPLQDTYFNNFYSLDGKQHSVAEMNLNHYSDTVLGSVKNAKVEGESLLSDTSKTIENQAELNTEVMSMAKGYSEVSKVESSSPIYNVLETPEAMKSALGSSSDVESVNYVVTGKAGSKYDNYTYYCYTSNANPQIVLDVCEADANGNIISASGASIANTSYPTVSHVESTSTSGGWQIDSDGNYVKDAKNNKITATYTPSATVYTKSAYTGTNVYASYLSNGMGTGEKILFQDGKNGANVSYSGYDSSHPENSYYNRKSQVVLSPSFSGSGSADRATVTYTISSHDDAFNGGNTATMSKLVNKSASNLPTSDESTSGTTITIVIEYHNTGKLSATAQQVEGDAFLNQFHLLRTGGGAQSYDFRSYGDSIYTVNDSTFGYAGYGSFTYTFSEEKTVEQAIDALKAMSITGLYNNYNEYNTAYTNLYNAAFNYAKSKNSTLTNMAFKNTYAKDMYKFITSDYQCTKKEKLTLGENYYKDFYNANASGYIAAFKASVAKQGSQGVFIGTNIQVGEGVSGNGTGFIPWGSNYSFNYHPASEAYTYVHLVDKWGNVFDGVFKTPKIDASSANLKVSSNEVSVLEFGGSGIDSISLAGANVSFITDDSSSFNGQSFTTSGNEIKLSTGTPNKTYQLTVKDNATNSNTESVTSNEDGIIVLSIADAVYDYDGAYTFTLNGTTVNLYDGATQQTVLGAEVSGKPSLNAKAVVNVKVSGSPELIKLVEKNNPTNTLTIQRSDVCITTESNAEIWQVMVYVDKLTSTYYVSARYSNGEYSNYIELTIVANEGNDYTVHSMQIADMVAKDGKTAKGNNGYIRFGRHDITIQTTTDVLKIQFVDSNGNTWTYDSRTAGLTSDSNGIRTWNISLNFCKLGDWRLTVRTRSISTSFASGVYEDLCATVLY